ncbi:DUF2924 domain-containing protein [Yoonia sp. SDW83-1]|uniref:DUF2924 domain-containing protein n=1 Tax=Yoonia sp. SDW83-1 TaxID=3366945 RepID=UPI00398C41DB
MSAEVRILNRWDELSVLDRVALRKEWLEIFGAPPAQFLSLIFMRKALIWQAQADAYGGLRQNSKRMLAAAADGGKIRPPKMHLPPGTQLVREWNGRRYLVNVTQPGFELDGSEYASLTAVARHITGANWSGPRFFGLTSAKRKAA